MTRLLIVALLTAVIHMINTLIYSVRLAGVRTQRLATALSLFQVIFLIASTANLIQAPLMSSIVEHAINAGLKHASSGNILADPYYQSQLARLNMEIRMVIMAATGGTIVGGLFLPTFVRVFTRGIMLLEDLGSVPRLIFKMILSPRQLFAMARKITLPGAGRFRDALRRPLNIPRYFLVANILITGIWTTGVLSALYAGALIPLFRSTATLTSGIINGVAAVLAATVVDPTAAMITDQAMRGVRPEEDVKQMAVYLALTRLAGTLLAQALFVPGALVIRFVAEIIT
ncbi:lipid II flippase Amj family protein [Desulfofundulus sp.]|uniref:lipid II flippase Amj family protein n=1 Tax=Desulfofundulus sp. TaxID=2282750 RepID=UPI003C7688B2